MTDQHRLDEEPVKVSIRYRGPSVDDGTMPVTDVLSALRGFAGAYGKIASQETPTIQHELRVSAVKSSSFDLILYAACVILKDPETQSTILEAVSGAGQHVVRFLLSLIQATKHTKGKPSTINVSGTGNTVNIVNIEGSNLNLPKRVAESFKEKLAAPELGKIVSLTRPIFCTNPSERVYITAWGCEIGSGRRNGLQAPGAGGL